MEKYTLSILIPNHPLWFPCVSCISVQYVFAEMQALTAYLKGTDIETAMLSNCVSSDIKEG